MNAFTLKSCAANCPTSNGQAQTSWIFGQSFGWNASVSSDAANGAVSVMFELVLVTALFAGSAVISLRTVQQWQFERTRQVYELQFPYDLKAEAVTSFMRSLSGLMPVTNRRPFGRLAAVLEVWGDGAGIHHRLHVPEHLAGPAVTQLRAAVPGVRILPVETAQQKITKLTAGVELGLNTAFAALRIASPAAVTTATLASLQPLGRGEAICMQWVLCPTVPRNPNRPKRSRSVLARLPWWVQSIAGLLSKRELSSEQLASAQTKLAEPLFAGICRIGATASNPARARRLVRQTLGTLHITRSHSARFVRQPVPTWLAARKMERATTPVVRFPLFINASELAAVTAWPLESPALPGLKIGASRQLPPSSALPYRGHVIGSANFPGAERLVAIGVNESLRHIHAIGPTGSGKSTLLINMITQDMQAGRGVAVFDPKGDLITDLLDRIPAGRAADVILVDPTDPERSVGLNLLEKSGMASEVIVDQVVGVFKRLFAGFWGPRTDDVLRSALLSLMHSPDTTLCDVPLLLQDPAYRRQILDKIDDPIGLAPFWQWYEGLSDKEQAQVVGPVSNKLRALLLRRSVRDIFGQSTSTFRMGDVLARNKILLISLPKGQLGQDTSALLGSMLVMKLWQEAQKRGMLPLEKRTPFMCYIDEFQDYLNLPSGISDILAQARGFGLGLVMAHQHLGQLTREVREAVLANARSKIVFQTNAADSRLLAKEFSPYLTPNDLQNLEPYQAMALVYVEGQKAAPVSIATSPAPEVSNDRTAVQAMSSERYGTDRSEIEQYLRSRLTANFSSDEVGVMRVEE